MPQVVLSRGESLDLGNLAFPTVLLQAAHSCIGRTCHYWAGCRLWLLLSHFVTNDQGYHFSSPSYLDCVIVERIFCIRSWVVHCIACLAAWLVTGEPEV